MNNKLRRKIFGLAVVIAFGAQALTVSAQGIKIGIVGPFSGPGGHFGTFFKTGVEAYLASQGGQLAGKQVELIYRDTGGPNPGGTKTLVQELIVKDKVDYLGGFLFTPNAFAVAPLIQESATPTVIFNAAISGLPEKSDFFIRTSYTLSQLTVPLARWAAQQNIKKAQDLDVPVTKEQIKVVRNGVVGTGSVEIEAAYTVHVNLPFYPMDLNFNASARNKGVF